MNGNNEHIAKDVPGEIEIFKIRQSFLLIIARVLSIDVGFVALIFIFINSSSVISGMSDLVFMLVQIGLIALAVVINLIFLLVWYSTVYRMTTKKVVCTSGILGYKEELISISDIQSIEVVQSIWGEILNFGNISIRSASERGLSDKPLVFSGIASPRHRAELIQDQTVDQ